MASSVNRSAGQLAIGSAQPRPAGPVPGAGPAIWHPPRPACPPALRLLSGGCSSGLRPRLEPNTPPAASERHRASSRASFAREMIVLCATPVSPAPPIHVSCMHACFAHPHTHQTSPYPLLPARPSPTVLALQACPAHCPRQPNARKTERKPFGHVRAPSRLYVPSLLSRPMFPHCR